MYFPRPGPSVYATHVSFFSEQHLLIKQIGGWTGTAGAGGGSWVGGGRVDGQRKSLDSEKHREPEGNHGRKVMETAAAPYSPTPLPAASPPISSLGIEAVSRQPRGWLTGAVDLQ